jgi:hypothetical protein
MANIILWTQSRVESSVITSGGNVLSEIFYRRSNIGGTSWDPPIRLSAGNEQKFLDVYIFSS